MKRKLSGDPKNRFTLFPRTLRTAQFLPPPKGNSCRRVDARRSHVCEAIWRTAFRSPSVFSAKKSVPSRFSKLGSEKRRRKTFSAKRLSFAKASSCFFRRFIVQKSERPAYQDRRDRSDEQRNYTGYRIFTHKFSYLFRFQTGTVAFFHIFYTSKTN